MRRVFSSIELAETILVRDALLHRGFDVVVHNEYSGTTPIPEFRPPAEIWLRDDDDYTQARQVVTETLATLDRASTGRAWMCSSCHEENPGTFHSCWNCERDKDADADASRA
jgi:hypothetical protein